MRARCVTGACPLLVDGDGKPVMRTRPFPDSQALAAVRAGGELGWIPIPDESLALERSAVVYPGREALLIRKQFVAGMNYFDERFGEYWADADLAIKVRKAGRKLETYPAIRATWHAPAEAAPNDTIHRSDRIVGAAALLSRRSTSPIWKIHSEPLRWKFMAAVKAASPPPIWPAWYRAKALT